MEERRLNRLPVVKTAKLIVSKLSTAVGDGKLLVFEVILPLWMPQI